MDGNSNNRVEEGNFSQSDTGADFSTLPEACIVYILALTSPPDVCRMRAVAQWLLPAVESDALWLRFLPDDYQQILARSAESPSLSDSSSKKELFFRLCDSPLLIDEGKKLQEKSQSHWALDMVFCTRISIFRDCVYSGLKSMLVCYLREPILKTNSFGFEDAVVKSSIKIGDETTERRWMTNQRVLHSAQDPTTIRKDRWLEIELGEFFTEGREDIIGRKVSWLKGLRLGL